MFDGLGWVGLKSLEKLGFRIQEVEAGEEGVEDSGSRASPGPGLRACSGAEIKTEAQMNSDSIEYCSYQGPCTVNRLQPQGLPESSMPRRML